MTPEIEKVGLEAITKYILVKSEVLDTEEERRLRFSNLGKAMILGKKNKGHVHLAFDTTEGIKSIDVSILDINENEIYIKGGYKIPMHCIREVFI